MLYSAAGRSVRPPITSYPQLRAATLRKRIALVNVLDEITADQLRTDLPEIASGRSPDWRRFSDNSAKDPGGRAKNA